MLPDQGRGSCCMLIRRSPQAPVGAGRASEICAAAVEGAGGAGAKGEKDKLRARTFLRWMMKPRLLRVRAEAGRRGKRTRNEHEPFCGGCHTSPACAARAGCSCPARWAAACTWARRSLPLERVYPLVGPEARFKKVSFLFFQLRDGGVRSQPPASVASAVNVKCRKMNTMTESPRRSGFVPSPHT